MEKKKRHILLKLLLAVVVLCVVVLGIASYRQAEARKSAVPYDAPGIIVSVDGRDMYVEIGGKEGATPVVFVPGLGDGAYSFAPYVGAIADRYRTVLYDPAGIGDSDVSPNTSDPDGELKDLRALLDATGIEGPYILVGHSRGGALVRRYAQLFPEETAGVVLVDSTNEAMISDSLARASYALESLSCRVLGAFADFGIPRLIEDLGGDLLSREIDDAILTARGPEYLAALNESCLCGKYITTVDGQFGTVNHILDTIREGPQNLAVPAYVLYEIATDDPDSDPRDTADMLRVCVANIEKEFSVCSSATVYDAGHYLHISVPDEVTKGIDWVAAQCRDDKKDNG